MGMRLHDQEVRRSVDHRQKQLLRGTEAKLLGQEWLRGAGVCVAVQTHTNMAVSCGLRFSEIFVDELEAGVDPLGV